MNKSKDMSADKKPLDTLRRRQDILRSLHKDDNTKDAGAMFLVTIVIMLTMFMLLTAALMWTMSSVQITSLQASSHESVIASESGRDNALSDIANDECDVNTQSTLNSSSHYENNIYRFSDTTGVDTPDDITDLGVHSGCPASNTTHVLIESIGYSNNPVTGGESSQVIVSTYAYDADAETITDYTPLSHIEK